MAIGYGQPDPKPEKRSTTRRRAKREQSDRHAEIRVYVFARERNVYRCCRTRRAESMHEIRPRSLRARVSKLNSIAVCGDGTTKCHGHLQRHEIEVDYTPIGAEGRLIFRPTTFQAAEWVKIAKGEVIESLPMQHYEGD